MICLSVWNSVLYLVISRSSSCAVDLLEGNICMMMKVAKVLSYVQRMSGIYESFMKDVMSFCLEFCLVSLLSSSLALLSPVCIIYVKCETVRL